MSRRCAGGTRTVRRRQRLVVEHVQAGVGEMTAVECRRAGRPRPDARRARLDQPRARGSCAISRASRMARVSAVSGSRQTRMSIPSEEGRQLPAPARQATLQPPRVRLQPRTAKPWRASTRAASPPSSPRPMMPTRVAPGGGATRSRQPASRCWRGVTSSARWYFRTCSSTNSLICRVSDGSIRRHKGRSGSVGSVRTRRPRRPATGRPSGWAGARSRPGGARQTRATSIAAGSPVAGQARQSRSGSRRRRARRQAWASSSGL